MVRDDLSDRLIHLTRGSDKIGSNSVEDAVNNLYSILGSSTLKGGTGYIKGDYRCICFSESPVSKLPYIMAHASAHKFKYQPYGVMISKRWFYQQGGRPVIYGPSEDFEKLPDDMKYRHVRLHYGAPYDVDFTWEREWRLRADELKLDPDIVTVVVPTREARDGFVSNLGDQWHYLVLSDLGVPLDLPALLDGKK